MLPKDLENIFHEYEGDFTLYITRVDYATESFYLDFDLDVQNINNKGAISQKWTIEVIGYRKSQVSFEFTGFLKIIDDHPLLWEFTDTQCELYFNGQVTDAAKLFLNLFQIHKKLFKSYQPFDLASFDEDTLYFKPFQYSNGLLAKGSKKLMELYANCLKQNGLNYSILGERQPTFWDGHKYLPENQNLKLLVIGDSFVIAENFSFKQQQV